MSAVPVDLTTTTGFVVADNRGKIVGRVECPMYGTLPDVPDALSVRGGRWSRHRRLVPVPDVLASDRSLRIAEHVPESVVTVFFASLGASFHKEQTQPRDAESLRHLLKAMPRDRRLRFPWQPALKRLWKRWTGR